ncbi:MAG: F0F1 ATP synthase subunit A [Flavobacteriales bacterium]
MTTFAAHFQRVIHMLNVLTSVISLTKKSALAFLAVALMFSTAFGQHEGGEEAHGEKFKPGEMIMHHISDGHQIHIIGQVYIPLPVIIYHEGHLDIFSSSNFWNGFDAHGELQFQPYTASSGLTYVNHHEFIELAEEHAASHDMHTADHAAPAHHEPTNEGQMVVHHAADTTGHHVDTLQTAVAAPAADAHAEHHGVRVMDFSITKNVFGMFLVIVIMIIVFKSIANAYKKRPGQAPKGMQNLFEPFILFIRNEVAIPSIGKKKADKFVPFLLTVFFFIWMSNMLGLIPFVGGFNITGTMSITLVLAALVFIITTINANGHYWGHIFWPPGVPLPIKFILVPIEFVSVFQKPMVLMVRLTANITAGHIIILAFVGLVLLFGQTSAVAGYGVGVGAVAFMVFMFFIELLVAFLQAYVFTLLAALYFGDATQEHHHEEDHH